MARLLEKARAEVSTNTRMIVIVTVAIILAVILGYVMGLR